jgi:hypothetical protein
VLVGREGECARVDRLLAAAATGSSGVLVARGEPGIGTSALLAYAAGAAERMTVVRALGVESEAELGFSGLLGATRLGTAQLWPARRAYVAEGRTNDEVGAAPFLSHETVESRTSAASSASLRAAS